MSAAVAESAQHVPDVQDLCHQAGRGDNRTHHQHCLIAGPWWCWDVASLLWLLAVDMWPVVVCNVKPLLPIYIWHLVIYDVPPLQTINIWLMVVCDITPLLAIHIWPHPACDITPLLAIDVTYGDLWCFAIASNQHDLQWFVAVSYTHLTLPTMAVV